MKTLFLLLTIPTLLLITACGDDDEEEGTGATPTSATTLARTAAAATPFPDSVEDVCAENPDPAADETNQVDEPLEGDEVSSPLTVRGVVAAFEATFRITLFDEDGNELADLTAYRRKGRPLRLSKKK